MPSDKWMEFQYLFGAIGQALLAIGWCVGWMATGHWGFLAAFAVHVALGLVLILASGSRNSRR